MGIEVEGRVRIGRRLELTEGIAEAAGAYQPDFVVGSVLPPHARSPGLSPSPTRSAREDFEFALHETDEDVSFDGNGMTYQYGLLGGPGSGKTNTLVYLLRQLAMLRADPADPRGFSPGRKFGGLILDPKAALVDHVQRCFAEAGRAEDVVVINRDQLARNGGVNLLDCPLEPGALGRILVLAAKSAGIGGSEPFWLQQMTNAFGAILALMKLRDPDRAPTLKDLLAVATGSTLRPGQRKARSNLSALVNEVRAKVPGAAEAPAGALADAQLNLDRMNRHAGAEDKTRMTVEMFMEQAFSAFRESANACYSEAGADNIYRAIFDEGKVVLVSADPSDVSMSRILPSLVKLIMQRMVLARESLFRNWKINNAERPVFLVADEYHMVATQIPGEPIGDAEYFSMAREFGGFAIVAAQTVHQLRGSSLGEAWEAVFGTLAAVIGMKTDDPETIAYLQRRGGKKSVLETSRSIGMGGGDVTLQESSQRSDVPRIPEDALKLLATGMGVVVGTTRDHKEPTGIRYVRVPWAWDPVEWQRP